MTDEQIIKAFEEVSEDNHMSTINQMICGDALDLINRQKAEIEELRFDKIIAERHEKDARDLFVDCTRQLEETKTEIEKLKVELKAMRGAAEICGLRNTYRTR